MRGLLLGLALAFLLGGSLGFDDCQPCPDPSQLFCSTPAQAGRLAVDVPFDAVP